MKTIVENARQPIVRADIGKRIDLYLGAALSRLRQLGGAVVAGERSGTIETDAAGSGATKSDRRVRRSRHRIARRSFQTRRTVMRHDEAFVLGAMIGAVAVWLWGRNITDRITEQTRAIRTKAADGIQAVEETIRPAVNL
jgi:hypothetical protein